MDGKIVAAGYPRIAETLRLMEAQYNSEAERIIQAHQMEDDES